MLKKIAVGVLTLLLMMSLIGCGGGADKKNAASDVESTPEKAILAYAQLYSFGDLNEDVAMKITGLTQEEIKEVQMMVVGGPMFAFSNFSLSKPNLESVVNQYTGKMRASMNVKTKLKKDDPANPVVELTATTAKNDKEANKVSEEEIKTLQKTMDELKAKGLTDEQLFNDENYQAVALESLNKVIEAIPFNDEASIEIPCVIVEKNGKKYWAPKDISVIEDFFWGKK